MDPTLPFAQVCMICLLVRESEVHDALQVQKLYSSYLISYLMPENSYIQLLRATSLLQLLLAQMPELVDLRRLARNHTLSNLDRTADCGGTRSSILRRLARDLDHNDTRILGTTIVLSITEVAEPGFEGGGVVLADLFAVGLDGGFAANAGPFAGVVEEAEVDVRMGFEVVGFAGFGVGVEDEVDVVLLSRYQ